MKMGRLIAAAVVLAALGATLFWSNHRKAAQDAAAAAGSATTTSIISLKQDDISKLEIKKKDGDDVVLDQSRPRQLENHFAETADCRPGTGFDHAVRSVPAQGRQGDRR